eukprot:scaffold63165_cov69-Phaeocystis_antarctica.AAC.1
MATATRSARSSAFRSSLPALLRHARPCANEHGCLVRLLLEVLNTTRSGGHKFKVDAITVRWERDDGGDAAAAARTAACRRMIRQDQLEQSELEMSSASKRLYLERCAVSGAAGLALERQGTPARPAAAPGSSLSYPGYCDKTQAGE